MALSKPAIPASSSTYLSDVDPAKNIVTLGQPWWASRSKTQRRRDQDPCSGLSWTPAEDRRLLRAVDRMENRAVAPWPKSRRLSSPVNNDRDRGRLAHAISDRLAHMINQRRRGAVAVCRCHVPGRSADVGS